MITSRRRRAQSGVALLTATIIVLIVGGIAAAFLMLSFSQSNVIAKSSDSEVALHIAEAGIDDTLNKLSAYANDWAQKIVTPTTSDYIVIANPAPIIKGNVNRGSYVATLEDIPSTSPVFTTPFTTFKITSTGTKDKVTRSIEVVTAAVDKSNLFKYGLFGDVTVTAGGTFNSDGYDSSKGTYAAQLAALLAAGKGTYKFPDGKSTTYIDATGSIGSNGDIKTGGAAMVMGNANAGPGHTTSGGGDIYGSTTPASTIEALTTQTYTVPSPAPTSWTWTGGPASVGGATDTVVHMSTFAPTGPGTLTINGNVTMYVDSGFVMNSKQFIKMASGATLTLKVGAGDIHVNGQAFAGTAHAKDFQIYSPTTGDIQFNGGSNVYAAVYAPKASFTNNGGNQFYGAMVASTMKLNGTAYFHYDEDLAKLSTPKPEFVVLSWREILK